MTRLSTALSRLLRRLFYSSIGVHSCRPHNFKLAAALLRGSYLWRAACCPRVIHETQPELGTKYCGCHRFTNIFCCEIRHRKARKVTTRLGVIVTRHSHTDTINTYRKRVPVSKNWSSKLGSSTGQTHCIGRRVRRMCIESSESLQMTHQKTKEEAEEGEEREVTSNSALLYLLFWTN
jgi:hypothetical protein